MRRSVADPLPLRRISSAVMSVAEYGGAEHSQAPLRRPRSRQPVVYARPAAAAPATPAPVEGQEEGPSAVLLEALRGKTLTMPLLAQAPAAVPPLVPASDESPVDVDPPVPDASSGHVCDYSYLLDAAPPVVESRGPDGATLKYAPWRMRWPR